MTPLVSHLIVAYQQARYLEAAVVAAVEQSYQQLEVIVADDGSTDGTEKLLAGLSERFGARLRVVRGPNLGITGNSNRALHAARGELISFQGGDDLLLPGKVEQQVNWFRSNASAVLCGHRMEHFQDDGSSPPFVPVIHTTSGVGADAFIRRGPPFDASSMMVRRVALPDRGFDERLKTISDWKLWVDVLRTDRAFGMVDSVLGRYRLHRQSVSHSRPDLMDQDRLSTLAFVELELPSLSGAVHAARAVLLRDRALRGWESGDYGPAHAYFSASLRADPFQTLGVWARWALSTDVPGSDRLRRLADRLTRLKNRGAHVE